MMPSDAAGSHRAGGVFARLEGLTRVQQARVLGVSLRALYYLLEAEREGVAEWHQPPPPPPPAGRPGAEELPYVELTHGPPPTPRPHYRLDADRESVLPGGPFRIGTHSGRGCLIKHREDSGCRVEARKESTAKHTPPAARKGKGCTPGEVEAIKAKYRGRKKKACV